MERLYRIAIIIIITALALSLSSCGRQKWEGKWKATGGYNSTITIISAEELKGAPNAENMYLVIIVNSDGIMTIGDPSLVHNSTLMITENPEGGEITITGTLEGKYLVMKGLEEEPVKYIRGK